MCVTVVIFFPKYYEHGAMVKQLYGVVVCIFFFVFPLGKCS